MRERKLCRACVLHSCALAHEAFALDASFGIGLGSMPAGAIFVYLWSLVGSSRNCSCVRDYFRDDVMETLFGRLSVPA
jgi:hypothetical protein